MWRSHQGTELRFSDGSVFMKKNLFDISIEITWCRVCLGEIDDIHMTLT